MDAGNRFVANLLASSPRSTPRAEILQFRELGAKCKHLLKGCLTGRILCGLHIKKIGKGMVNESHMAIIP
jgi:hypothetical protein